MVTYTQPQEGQSRAGVVEVYRRLTRAVEFVSEGDRFFESLCEVIGADPYLANHLIGGSVEQNCGEKPAEEVYEKGKLVVPVSEDAIGAYLSSSGRRDGEPFGAEDLHLMGSIAGFVSALMAQAQTFRRKADEARVFQYLINQLPLGVVCFDAEGGLIVENKLASRLLRNSGADLIRGALAEKSLKEQGKIRLHLEVDGKLLYTEGRRLQVDNTLAVSAFVLHDMSAQREKHLLQLERSVFRAESRHVPLTVAVLEDRSEAGRLYRILKASAASLQLEDDGILALDAYTCACVFTGKHLRSARYLLKNGLPQLIDRKLAKGALMAEWMGLDEEAPAQSLIEAAQGALRPLDELLRPALLVLDPYPAVMESLEWIGGEIASFERIGDPGAAAGQVESGLYDGIFFDIDTFGERGLDWLQTASAQAGGGFRIYYLSHKQPSMVYTHHGLGVDSIIFQKPFDTAKLRETLALQFDFA